MRLAVPVAAASLLAAVAHPQGQAQPQRVGGVLSFGETTEAAAIGITMRDERCSMVNFDRGSAR